MNQPTLMERFIQTLPSVSGGLVFFFLLTSNPVYGLWAIIANQFWIGWMCCPAEKK